MGRRTCRNRQIEIVFARYCEYTFVAEEQMMVSWGHRGACVALGCSLALAPIYSEMAWAQANIGNTQIVVNDVKGTVGQSEPAVLRVGIDIFQNEVIRTGERSASKVVF